MTVARGTWGIVACLGLAIAACQEEDAPAASALTVGVLEVDTNGMEPLVIERIAMARSAVEAEAGSAVQWGRFGAVLEIHGLDDEALVAYERAHALAPDEFRWPYHLGCVAANGGRPTAEVVRWFEVARAIDPEYRALDVRIGDAYARSEDYPAAVIAYRRALEHHPNLAQAHRGLGFALLGLDANEDARRAFERAVELAPTDGRAWSGLARAWQLVGEGAHARAALERSRDLPAVDDLGDTLRHEVSALGVGSHHLRTRGRALQEAGRHPDAVRELERLVGVLPEDANARWRLGVSLWQTGQGARARAEARRAVAHEPDLAPAWLDLGRIEMSAGDADRALAAFERAAELDPDLAPAHVGAATVLLATGRIEDAVRRFEAGEHAADLDAAALVNWATALVRIGAGGAARDRAALALEREPDAARVHLLLGAIDAAEGRFEDAVERFHEAAALDPTSADALVREGDALLRLERRGAAWAAWRQVLALDPDHPIGTRLTALEGALGAGGGVGPRVELEAVARRLRASNHEYLGTRPLERLEQRLEREQLVPLERAEVARALAVENLELGRLDAAERALDVATAALREARARPTTALVRTVALCAMRRAEVENCVERNNADCCLFPLAGAGVHAEPGPAERALAHYLALAQDRPDDLGVRWLANVAAMAAGRHPDGLDEPLRIPTDPFAADTDASIRRFRNVAVERGVDARNLCGGVVAEDFDGDGRLDVLTSTSDPAGPLVLYVNVGDGRFEDRSAAWGADQQLGGLNLVAGDYDGDGDVDVLVLRGAWLLDHGRIRNSLLRNDGDRFSDVTVEAGLAWPAYPTQAAAWSDFDLDGDLDLYVANESRREISAAGGGGGSGDFPSQLFENRGDGTFRDVATRAGVTNDRYAKGVCVGDLDEDGDTDLYVSNNGPNRLYRNDGGLAFTDVAVAAGVVEPTGRSFACWFFDVDHDGDLDLFVGAFQTSVADIAAEYLGRPTTGEPPRLYRNRGDGTFEDATVEYGLDRLFLPMGASFGDLDGDGWLDVYLTTGDPDYETLVPNVMLRNVDGRRFEDVTRVGGFGHLQKGHGVAFADLDDDGDQDVYHQLGGFYPGDAFPNALFENPGHGARFLTVELEGARSHRSGAGARLQIVVATPEGSRTIYRAAGSVSSFGGSPARQEIGLGDAVRIERLEVRWPRSDVQVFDDVPLDRRVRVVEGDPKLYVE